MRTAKCLIIAIVLGIITSTLPAAEGDLSDTQQASGLVRITADSGIVPLNPQTVEALLFSSAVAGEAIRNVLGRDFRPEDRETIRVEWLSQNAQRADAQRSPLGAPRSYEEQMMRDVQEEMGRMYMPYLDQSRGSKSERPAERGDPNGGGDPFRKGSSRPSTGIRMGGGMSGMGGGMMGGAEAEGYGMGGFGGMGGAMGGFGGMGGYGGTGAGMGMGGTGMGGMGMGGMGMGMGGMYGMYGGPAPAQTPGGEQSVTVRLSVDLPDDKPAARELLNALVVNLRETLTDAYDKHAEQLRSLLEFAESQREYAQKRLFEATGSSPEDRRRMEEQLGTYVDLSALSSEMPAAAAIELLRNSVEPPLNIVVLWDDLGIEPSNSINVNGLGAVMLRTALEVVVKALTYRVPSTYAVKNDVIVIGSEQSVSRSAEVGQQPKVESDSRALAGQSSALTRQIQSLELDLAGLEARRQAIREQIARVRREADARLTEDAVTRELKTLVQTSENNLGLLRKQVDAGRASTVDLSQAFENLTRAKIELAKRQEELAASAGGNQLSDFNKELNEITVDMAGRKAQLEILHRQLTEVRQELAQASAFSPEAAKIRMAREMLDIIERRMATIQMQLANLQPPTVTMIGAN